MKWLTKKKDTNMVDNNPLQILAAAIERDIDTEKLRELMTLEREWRADKAKSEYAIAMTAFGQIKQTIAHNRKGTTAGSTPFSYTDFPAMVTAVTPWMSECGLSFSHYEDPPVFNDKGEITCIIVYCTVRHNAGHCEEFHYPAIPDERLRGKVSPSQLIQLAITYSKRQTLAMGLGIATSEDRQDDDSTTSIALVSDEQAANIKSLIDEVGDEGKQALFKWLDIDAADQVPVKYYSKAVQGLKARRK